MVIVAPEPGLDFGVWTGEICQLNPKDELRLLVSYCTTAQDLDIFTSLNPTH